MRLSNSFVSLSFLFFVSTSWSASLQIKTIKPLQTLSANQIQETSIAVELPKHFHLYKDQLEIRNIVPPHFKSGQIRIFPEVEFFDKFSKKNRAGLSERGTISILFEAPDRIPAGLSQLEFDLRHQICSDQVCYLPSLQHVVVPVLMISAALPTDLPLTPKSISLLSNFENSLSTNLPLAFLLVFLAGILTSFTPCIFPMLPITLSILGHHAEQRTRIQNFMRSLIYVLGIATTYSLLGVAAALTGNLFGSALANKYIVLALCLLFIAMAFSMWGAFELQAPAFIRNRFGSGRSKNNFESYVMGLVAGIVASPCVGPVLVSILTFVSASRNVPLGFSLLFVFASGLGMLFIVIGLFGEGLRILPRSGPWMNFVKFILGACMWLAALYYLRFILPDRWWIAVVAASFVALAIWKGAFKFRQKAYLRQSFLLALFIFSFTVLLLSIVRPSYLSPAFQLSVDNTPLKAAALAWTPYSEAAMAQAKVQNQPVLIDFFADWCGACHELDKKIFNRPDFIELSGPVKLLKVDATDENDETQAIIRKYRVQGLPTVLFINRKGDLLKHLTFTQFIEWDEFKPKLLETLK